MSFDEFNFINLIFIIIFYIDNNSANKKELMKDAFKEAIKEEKEKEETQTIAFSKISQSGLQNYLAQLHNLKWLC
jgi:hypothetical protein